MAELCKTCQYHQWGCTLMLGGSVFREEYCGLTCTDEFCGEEFYKKVDE